MTVTRQLFNQTHEEDRHEKGYLEVIELKARDLGIQHGTNHACSTRSGKPARMLFVLIDGRFDPALAALFKTRGGA